MVRLLKILNCINSERYDIIHAHWAFPHEYIGLLLGKELGIPVVITAHGSDMHTLPRKK